MLRSLADAESDIADDYNLRIDVWGLLFGKISGKNGNYYQKSGGY